jgi:hypothetical protein
MVGARGDAKGANRLTERAWPGSAARAAGSALPRTSRRRLLGAVALAGAASAPTGGGRAVPALAQGTPAEGEIGRAEAPAWTFAVFAVQDPYLGEILQPQTAPTGTRYVSAEVQIDNASDQPLNFNPVEIRLRDAAGTEYRGGSAVGTEAYLSVRNLNGGERSHGWVWFTVPENVEIVEIAYYGPQPVFSVVLAP